MPRWRRRRRFYALAASLDAMSPLKVLGRGYAVARTANGTVLKSSADRPGGERMRLRLGQRGPDLAERSYRKEEGNGGKKDV